VRECERTCVSERTRARDRQTESASARERERVRGEPWGPGLDGDGRQVGHSEGAVVAREPDALFLELRVELRVARGVACRWFVIGFE
jgi:hypothetical protein